MTRTGFLVGGATTAFALTALLAVPSLSAQAKSQWDGVYTMEQAGRGEKLYAEQCASCHGDALTGGEMAPALVGGEFTANWNDLSLGDLFERIRISMPQDNPGSLTRQQNADVLAFMLSRGGYPAGKMDLPTELPALRQVTFLATKPSGGQ